MEERLGVKTPKSHFSNSIFAESLLFEEPVPVPDILLLFDFGVNKKKQPTEMDISPIVAKMTSTTLVIGILFKKWKRG